MFRWTKWFGCFDGLSGLGRFDGLICWGCFDGLSGLDVSMDLVVWGVSMD